MDDRAFRVAPGSVGTEPTDVASNSGALTDAELAELALAADPDDVEIDEDAVPFGVDPNGSALLPSWYMPAPRAPLGGHRRRRAWIVAGLVVSMVVVNAVGLCVTYGIPEVGARVARLW